MRYAELWAARPSAWDCAAAAWRPVTALLRRRAAEVTGVAAGLAPDWTGAAAGAARDGIGRTGRDLAGTASLGIEVDQILAEYASRLATAKARLTAAVARQPATGIHLDRDGGVRAEPGADPPTRRLAAEMAAGIGAALALAGAADREAAARLAALTTAIADGWSTPPPSYRPPPGASPQLARLWWDGLSAAQRRWLVNHEPELVGGLDGIPADARDQANRLLLDAHRRRLLEQRLRLSAQAPLDPLETAALLRLDARIRGLASVADRLGDDAAPRAYLLGLATAGDGRAVVALGNPDRAANVVTYVPGMTSELGSIDRELTRAERLAVRCAELEPATGTSVLLWLDYDAPDFLGEGTRDAHATAAGPALHRFQEGLRLTHEGPPAHQTVLGHSYGSLVVGAAARDHGLAADALVFVGSPGVGVDHAAALRIEPERVFSALAADDAVRHARPVRDLVGAAGGPLVPLAEAWLGQREDRLWFGRNPADPDFGGQTFASTPDGHSGYWNAGNPALDAMARIALGGRP